MVSKRPISFPRQILICLSFSVIAVICSISCQKDQDLKAKDPEALTKSEAKAYFEQTATTLKFLTATSGPAETKNQDYSLTENMVIEWEQAMEGETAESSIVEVPIRMASPVTAMLYDGLGHINKNIRQVPLNTSLLIEKHKDDGCMHHSVVTTVGSYSKNGSSSKYPFLSDKTTFTGYQIFCSEDGALLCSKHFTNGRSESRNLYTEAQILKVDSLGNDLTYRGISFVFNGSLIQTKGGGGDVVSGEDNICPGCNKRMDWVGQDWGMITYYCPRCHSFKYVYIDPVSYCPVCGREASSCICCEQCKSYPCICCDICNSYPCICNPNPEPNLDPDPEPEPEPEPDPQPEWIICSLCGRQGCNGLSCQEVTDLGNSFVRIIIDVDSGTPYGSVSKSPTGCIIGVGVNVTIEATPDSGYHFVGWKIDNSIVYTQNPYSFTATNSRNIYAVFAVN